MTYYITRPLTGEDILFTMNPFHHSTGIYWLVTCLLHGITRILTTQPYSSSLMVNIINKYRVTTLVLSPYKLAQLNASDILHKDSLKTYCSGNIIHKTLLERIHQILPRNVCNIYSLSEFTDIIALNELGAPIQSVGVLNDNVFVRIVNEFGDRCGVGSQGELMVWSPIPAIGYWNDPEATAELLDGDGWLRTGDVGYFDADGFLYVVSRQRDIIWYRGILLNTLVIENLIMQLDGVAEVCIVGVSNAETCELPAAVVRRHVSGVQVTEAQIQAVVKGISRIFIIYNNE